MCSAGKGLEQLHVLAVLNHNAEKNGLGPESLQQALAVKLHLI